MEPYDGVREYLENVKRSGQLPTYGNTFLHTGESYFSPENVDFKSRFSRNVNLNVPFVSAAMDTVTEVDMAIAMARLGGLGVIHRKMEPKLQRKMVARVKHAYNGFIPDPVTIPAHWTIANFLSWIEQKGYKFRRFLVCDGTNGTGKLLGMLTGKDLQFCRDRSVTVGQVMTPLADLVVGTKGITKKAAYELMYDRKIESLPVPYRRGKYGLFLFQDLQRIFERIDPMANIDHNDRLRVGVAVGTTRDEIYRAELSIREGVDVIIIDVAHANSHHARDSFMEVIQLAKGKSDIVVGNISHPKSAVALAKWGIDGIKIGQGPGSICTTRIKTGTGAPQAWAVAACAQALRENGFGDLSVCADGGIVDPGNVPVALGLGAHSVMIGSKFAGTDESPGEIVYDQKLGRAKKYRGMGSRAVLRENANRYAQEHLEAHERVSEGVEGMVSYRGPLSLMFGEFKGGLGQGMYNAGCRTIEELREYSMPYFASPDAASESGPHDVQVTDAT